MLVLIFVVPFLIYYYDFNLFDIKVLEEKLLKNLL